MSNFEIHNVVHMIEQAALKPHVQYVSNADSTVYNDVSDCGQLTTASFALQGATTQAAESNFSSGQGSGGHTQLDLLV